MLLRLAAAWATEQEKEILREGVSLSEGEIADARAIGVQEPNQVRLLRIETIPRPSQPQLKATCEAIDFLTPATQGLTLGHGMFIRADRWRDRLLVVHELAHLAQYEKLGGIVLFCASVFTSDWWRFPLASGTRSDPRCRACRCKPKLTHATSRELALLRRRWG